MLSRPLIECALSTGCCSGVVYIIEMKFVVDARPSMLNVLLPQLEPRVFIVVAFFNLFVISERNLFCILIYTQKLKI